jgi:putative N6-adenine-specific DNA methylase
MPRGRMTYTWKDFLPRTARVAVNAKSVRSPLGVPTLQSVGKKAVVDAMAIGRLEETGPLYPVLISLSSGRAVVTLDTSGEGLHKRGYRTEAGEAPLKETLAAGMVLLSRWDASRPFADLLCGSGTIAIEAALIGANAAPGLSRSFAAEQWPHISAEAWRRAREEARSAATSTPASISASDRDARVLEYAGRNAERAGVKLSIDFRCVELSRLKLRGEYGCIVTNPPYAERLGDEREAGEVYRDLGRLFRDLPSWSLFALSANQGFERTFGARATKNRKLYNGNLRCYLHQYFGPLGPRS